jgi:hypothetical protein
MKSNMLFILFGVMILSLLVTYLPAQVKIGDNPSVQDPSAILELDSAHLGLLITRVSLSDVWDQTSIPAPANSLLVYNTNFGGGDDPVSPGFYYWRQDMGRWLRLVTSIASGNGGDVWIDSHNNLLSVNSANQDLQGQHNVILGYRAFADDNGTSGNVIAIGEGAAQHDITSGDARNIAIGYQAAFNNSGTDIIIMGREAAMNNTGNNVIGIGDYAAYDNEGSSVNALGTRAGYGNQAESVNAFGTEAAWANAAPDVNALGLEAAFTNTGYAVNAMGNRAAAGNVSENVNAFGNNAAEYNQGIEVNAFGPEAARHNTGWVVSAMGNNAASYNSGNDVNAFGNQTAHNNSGGSVNAMGDHSAGNNQGSLVNAFGGAAGENNIGWSVNVLGNQAGQFNQGSDINAMGAMAADHNTTACVNAFGLQSARYNTGYGTNAMGYQSAFFNNGEHAIAIGDQALLGDTIIFEGAGNIGIGYHAGRNVGTGYYNISIGYDTPIPDPSANDQINIGNNIIRTEDGVIQLKDVIRLTPLATAPTSPEIGTIYIDSSNDNKLTVWDGTTWQVCW